MHRTLPVHTVVPRAMADLATDDPRAARWERRLRAPVIVAALAVLETAGHWVIWLVFMAEVVVMLSLVRDRRAWIDGHRFELLVVALASPLVPLALALAPAFRLLILVKAFKALKLAKAIKLAKLGKSVRLLRRKVALSDAASLVLGVIALVLAALTTAYMLTGDSPLEGAGRTVALALAGMLATFGVGHLGRRTAGGR